MKKRRSNYFKKEKMIHTFDDGASSKIISDETLKKLLEGKEPYVEWDEKFLKFNKDNPDSKLNTKLTPDLVRSSRFQILNFMAEYSEYAFSRDQLIMIENALVDEKKSRDIIQLVNKTDQFGLKRYYFTEKGVTYYSIPRFVFTYKRLITRNENYSKKSYAVKEESSIQFWSELANGPFEKGHKDPRKPLTDENMVPQPAELNRTLKDHYICDNKGFPALPTPEHIMKYIIKYYSLEEMQELHTDLGRHLESLKNK